MSGYKKYEFDNFVLEDDREEVVTPVAEVATTEDARTINEDRDPDIVEVEPQSVEVAVVSYSEEELNSAKAEAEKAGYEAGYRAKNEEIDNQTTGLLVELDKHIGELLSQREQLQKELEQDFMALNLAVIKKLLPQISQEHAEEILTQFLDENFANFKSEAKLSFYFNPNIIGKMQAKIADLARINDFEGKIALHKDIHLGLSDCRVEWENGGVQSGSDKLLEKVNNLLEETATEN